MSFWEEIFKRGAQTPGKVEWGRSQGAAACPLQEKAANNELVMGEIKEKLTSAISMEVVERQSKEAIIPTLRDEVGTRANRAEQWISAAKKKKWIVHSCRGYCRRLYQKEEKWILPAEGLNTLLGFQEESAPAYAGISEEMIFRLL